MNLEQITPRIKEEVEKLGYDFISLTFKVEKGERNLTLTVDRVKRISINDIVSISEVINPLLDELIPEEEPPYSLICTSLGAEKEIKEDKWPLYVGSYVRVHLINPIDGENIYFGDLKEVNEDEIVIVIQIKSRKKDIRIAKSNISNIRLAIKF